MAVKANQLSFEKALEKLESIVDQLESGDVPLADAVKLFEEGIALRKRCLGLLKDAEKKIAFLSSSAAGEPVEADPPGDWEEDSDAD
jgi:exodeoxyribonuclease VII small subunit